MTVDIDTLNQTAYAIDLNARSVGSTINLKLPDLSEAARESSFPQSPGTTIAGITAITENLAQAGETPIDMRQPFVVLTNQVPGLSEDLTETIDDSLISGLNALEGVADTPGQATEGYLHEVVTAGTPQAVNHVLNKLTGKSPKELERVLRQLSPTRVSGQVLEGVSEFDEGSNTFTNSVTGLWSDLQFTMTSVQNTLTQAIPDITQGLIDNIAIDIDPDIQQRLQRILAVNKIPSETKNNILKNIYNKQYNEAAEIIRSFPTGLTDLTEILNELVNVEIRPDYIIGSRPRTTSKVDANDDTFGQPTHIFEYVETEEEFEAIIASSVRDITTFVMHITGTRKDPDSKDFDVAHTLAGFDGNQYHFIIRRDGRVQRGRPLSSAGSASGPASGNQTVNIAFVSTSNINVIQAETYKKISRAIYRVIPGAQFLSAAALANNGVRNPSAPGGIGFNPATINKSINGAGAAGGFFQPGTGVVTRDPVYEQPGLAQNLQPDLIAILEQAAAQTTGVVSLQTTSGVRRGEIGSGRHYEGWASDTALLDGNNRRLHVSDPNDLEIIQNFTRNFIQTAKSNGYRPSVGWANPNLNRSLYMGGDHGHFDIAAGVTTVKPVNEAIWGQSSPHGAAPQWLVQMWA